MAEETTRYYHIAPADYVSDWGLLSFDRQEEMGWEPVWKWEEGEYLDTDVVCLSTTLEDALEFRRYYMPDGRILAVDLPTDEYERKAAGITMVTVSEGYPAVYNKIGAEYITDVTDEVLGG